MGRAGRVELLLDAGQFPVGRFAHGRGAALGRCGRSPEHADERDRAVDDQGDRNDHRKPRPASRHPRPSTTCEISQYKPTAPSAIRADESRPSATLPAQGAPVRRVPRFLTNSRGRGSMDRWQGQSIDEDPTASAAGPYLYCPTNVAVLTADALRQRSLISETGGGRGNAHGFETFPGTLKRSSDCSANAAWVRPLRARGRGDRSRRSRALCRLLRASFRRSWRC